MKLKSFFIVIIIIHVYSSLYAQFNINSHGMVSITANTNDWAPGLRVYVPTYNSCAYNLYYGGRDRFFVHASGYLWCERGGYFGSDSTLKENICRIESPLNKLMQLKGYEYNFKEEKKGTKTKGYVEDGNCEERRLGLIAQEVEQVFPGIVKTIPNGTKAISYSDLTALLIESIKEQQYEIESLSKLVSSYQLDMLELKKQIDELNLTIYREGVSPQVYPKSENSNGNAKLFGNVPNPFESVTEISFEIPEDAQNVILILNDLNGSFIKTYTILQRGQGSVNINGDDMDDGLYLYTLLIDNKVVDTKRMVLMRE